jgi:hypothetical protein
MVCPCDFKNLRVAARWSLSMTANAGVSCLLPQNHFAEMNVQYLVVNIGQAHFGIHQSWM